MSKHQSAVTFLTPQQSKRYQLRKRITFKIQHITRHIIKLATGAIAHEIYCVLALVLTFILVFYSPDVKVV